MALTGRFNFRKTLTGKIVLQLEEDVKAFWAVSRKRPTRRRWRDANVFDLAKPELRALIDLRMRPVYPRSNGLQERPASSLIDDVAAQAPPPAEEVQEGRIAMH